MKQEKGPGRYIDRLRDCIMVSEKDRASERN